MIPYMRKKKILHELQRKEIVYIQEINSMLDGVSDSTIRRDLKNLEEEGQIELLHGGAAKIKYSSFYDMPIESKQHLHTLEKDIIARYAASLVKNGEVIYIDSGTTTLGMLKYLKKMKIQIITSNTYVLTMLKDAEFSCVFVGGMVEYTQGSVVGPITDTLLADMYFDKAFLGATGYSEKSGISTPDFREANKKRIIKSNSQNVYVLLDSSKAGKESLCKAFDLADCTVITDKITDILKRSNNYLLAD